MTRFLARLIDLVIRSAMWLLLPVGPVAAAIIARNGDYLSHYPRSLRASVRHVRGLGRGQPIRRAVERWLASGDDATETREMVSGACTHCGQCCLEKACIFLRYDEAGRSRCEIYNTRFWSLLPCGDYPLSASEITQYSCPSYSARTVRIIPIRALPVGNEEGPQRA
ncbi:MAG: hypothetical protein HONDAALG_00132 [Gammaproteobacteria bacterium]|nr:hypothetical protein [Gammaproteobacteria bacterium]